MRQFAVDCGVNQSTFSRMANQVFTGSSSEKVLRAIAEHADPESGVTLDMLMAANGMAKIMNSATVSRISGMEIEKRFKYALLHELKRAGDSVELEENMKFRTGMTFSDEPDIIIRSKLLESSSNLWAFDLLFHQQTSDSGENGRNNTTRIYGRRILDRMGRILPMFFGEEQGSEKIGKYSFVVIDKECFSYIKAEFANYCVPFDMSFILFDIDRDIIEEEFILKQPGGYVPNSVFDESYDVDS
ncbi:MAG: hypothetical protein NC548_39255 [Lachnospiraceae bacterium]|nr:hypothetical protein [Lachnospiraceae bacterium]